jgi:anaerobic ribonucleoside-triphosphate reductase
MVLEFLKKRDFVHKKTNKNINYCNSCDIAFEERDCPLCEANKTIEELRKEIDSLNEQLDKKEAS